MNQKSVFVATLTGMYFCSFFQRYAVPGPVFDYLQQHYGFSGAQLSLLGMMYVAIYAVMQIPAGIWIDRRGGIVSAAIGGVALLAGSALFLAGSSPATIFAGRALTAVGDSMMYLSLLKEITSIYGAGKFASVLGTASFVASIAGVIATLPLQSAVARWGYYPSFGAMLVFTLLVYGAFLVCGGAIARERRVAPPPPPRPRSFAALRNLHNLPVILGVTLAYSITFALQVIIGLKYLSDRQQLTLEAGSRNLFIMLTVSLLLLVGAPALSHWWGGRLKLFLVIGCGASVAGSAVLLIGVATPLPGWLLLLALCATAIEAGHLPLATAQLKTLNAPEDMATVGGILAALNYLAITVVSGAIAWVLDYFPHDTEIYPPTAYAAIFTLFLAVAIISLVCALFSRENLPVRQNRG